MSLEGSLFGDDDATPEAPAHRPVAPDGIADWQVEQLRRALDARGLTDMASRQQFIEELAGRPVTSLRDLHSSEARQLLEQIQTRSASAKAQRSGSSWDDRDEDTWIDKL